MVKRYVIIFDGPMSTIFEADDQEAGAEDGNDFKTCKKELLKYLNDQINDLKSIKQEIRAMKVRDFE